MDKHGLEYKLALVFNSTTQRKQSLDIERDIRVAAMLNDCNDDD